MSDHDAPAPGQTAEQPSRRTAVQFLTGFLGLLLNIIPIGIGGLFFLDPLLRKKKTNRGGGKAGPEGYVELRVTADVIPEDGTPVAVTVIDDLVDSWSMYRDEPIGNIWIRRQPDSGKFIAFNSVCPHLGCAVDYRTSKRDFYCPCHTSAFDLDGNKTNNIPPRNMDSLDVIRATDGSKDAAGNQLWVKYENFKGAISEKTPL